jgi:hypothetical protein
MSTDDATPDEELGTPFPGGLDQIVDPRGTAADSKDEQAEAAVDPAEADEAIPE